MEPSEVFLQAYVDTSKVDDAVQKAVRLNELIAEAKSLLDELASGPIEVSLAMVNVEGEINLTSALGT